MTESDKWIRAQTSDTEGYTTYQEFMGGLSSLTTRIRMFRGQIVTTIEFHLELSTRRNSAAYANAYSKFYSQMASIAARHLNEDLDQSFPVEVSFVPMMHPTEENRVFAAEKTAFSNLPDSLRTEFYRGLAIGDALCRCHSYGRYSLLIADYNTRCYNNIVSDGTKRTCRKVGVHRKEVWGKANCASVQVEYDRTYNRLEQRKNRKKISIDEWNIAVAKARELMEQAGRGELTDIELKRQLKLL